MTVREQLLEARGLLAFTSGYLSGLARQNVGGMGESLRRREQEIDAFLKQPIPYQDEAA